MYKETVTPTNPIGEKAMKAKVFKKLSIAAKHAPNGMLFRLTVGGETLYIAGPVSSINEVALLQAKEPKDDGEFRERSDKEPWVKSWAIVGSITARHLSRLGNGNWAHADPRWGGKDVFAGDTEQCNHLKDESLRATAHQDKDCDPARESRAMCDRARVR